MRVLLVEDEVGIASAVSRGLEGEGFTVDVALTGTEGLAQAREVAYDAIILDILLPGMNGYKVCATLREEGNWTPILMLTAKAGEYDEAEALDTGADDFLSKPFSFVVLMARLRAILRRGRRERPAVLVAGDLTLDPNALGVVRHLVGQFLFLRGGRTVGSVGCPRFACLSSTRFTAGARGTGIVRGHHTHSFLGQCLAGMYD